MTASGPIADLRSESFNVCFREIRDELHPASRASARGGQVDILVHGTGEIVLRAKQADGEQQQG